MASGAPPQEGTGTERTSSSVDALFSLADTVADRAQFLITRTADALADAPTLNAGDLLDRTSTAKGPLPDHFYAPFALVSLRNGEPVRELELPSPDCLPDLTRHIVDHGAVLVTGASTSRSVASPTLTCVPLIGSPAFTHGVASGVARPELQHSLESCYRGLLNM